MKLLSSVFKAAEKDVSGNMARVRIHNGANHPPGRASKSP